MSLFRKRRPTSRRSPAVAPEPVTAPAAPTSAPHVGRRLFGRMALGAILIALFVGGASASAILMEVNDDINIFVNAKKRNDIPGLKDFLSPATGAQTILLIGSDHRYADGKNGQSHSDTMLLVRLDPDRSATTVMSVPRDYAITLPGHGQVKLNASYFYGGPKGTIKTLKGILGTAAHPFAINHVININFGGFTTLLNKLGCVYVDVDRHYFNDNNPPAGPPGTTDYAVINVKAGYQKLCGTSGLAYVRYRHFDDDLVRAARQQSFLRQAKEQISVGQIFSDRKELLKTFGKQTSTDLNGDDIETLLRIVLQSAGHPVHQVKFPGDEGPTFVTAQPAALHKAVQEFMNGESSPGAKGTTKTVNPAKHASDRKKAKKQKTAVPAGLIENKTAGEDEGVPLATNPALRTLPVYYPTLMPVGAQYVSSDRRAYTIRDREDRKFRAYRIVASAGQIGQYYGIQGMTWKTPPILQDPDGTKKINGRTFDLFYDGTRLRLVAWRTPRAVYWISNTLLNTLTNAQMLGLAGSVRSL